MHAWHVAAGDGIRRYMQHISFGISIHLAADEALLPVSTQGSVTSSSDWLQRQHSSVSADTQQGEGQEATSSQHKHSITPMLPSVTCISGTASHSGQPADAADAAIIDIKAAPAEQVQLAASIRTLPAIQVR